MAKTTGYFIGALVDRSGTITTGGTAQTVMAANPDRKYLIFQNNSTGDLWINFDTVTAVIGQPSLKIPAGGGYSLESSFVSTQAMTVIGATTAQAFSCKEGV
jgi:hypothetical protein